MKLGSFALLCLKVCCAPCAWPNESSILQRFREAGLRYECLHSVTHMHVCFVAVLSRCFFFTTQLGGQVVSFSSKLSSLLLFPKHVNKASGRTGCAYVKQVVLVASYVNQAAKRTGGAYLKQLVLFAFLFSKHAKNQRAGQVVLISSNLSTLLVVSSTRKEISREERECPFEATCPRCFLFPKHVNKTAGRTGCAISRSNLP